MNVLFKPSIDFTQVDNALLSSVEVSLKAKGLYSYLISKPNQWRFSARGIASQMKEKKDAINSTLKELEDLKLLHRKKIKNGSKFVGIAYYVANLKDSTVSGFSVNGELRNISNTKLSIYKDEPKLEPKITYEQRKKAFGDKVKAVYNKRDTVSRELAIKFFDWWTEKNDNGRLMKFEKENTFSINSRMNIFIDNEKIKSKKKQVSATVTKNS